MLDNFTTPVAKVKDFKSHLILLPATIACLIYLLLAYFRPLQVVDIISSSLDGGFFEVILASLPVFLSCGFVLLIVRPKKIVSKCACIAPYPAFWIMVAANGEKSFVTIVSVFLATIIGLIACLAVERHRSEFKIGCLVAIVISAYATAVIALLMSPILLPQNIGPLGVLTVGLALGTVFYTVVFIKTWLGLTAISLIIISLMIGNTKSLDFVTVESKRDQNPIQLLESVKVWLNERADLNAYRVAKRPYPLIVVSSEGGGIYAAAHSFMALTAMTMTCPNFPQHLFAAVGISGGSIGNLLFSESVSDFIQPSNIVRCEHRKNEIDGTPVLTDFLSPILANVLLLQPLDALFPKINSFKDTGETLEGTISAVYPNSKLLNAPLRKIWNPKGMVPINLFVASDADSGNRFILTPLAGAGAFSHTFPNGGVSSDRDITASSAASISARFPWLTQTAQLSINEEMSRKLADGGYFENSGADTAMDIIRGISGESLEMVEECRRDGGADGPECDCPIIVHKKFRKLVEWKGCENHIFIAYMPITKYYEDKLGFDFSSKNSENRDYIFDPIKLMLATRDARGQLALLRAQEHFCGLLDPICVTGINVDVGIFEHTLPVDYLKLPLGWKISKKLLQKISEYAAPTSNCGLIDEYAADANVDVDVDTDADADAEEFGPDASVDENDTSEQPPNNGCTFGMMAALFDPEKQTGSFGLGKGHGP